MTKRPPKPKTPDRTEYNVPWAHFCAVWETSGSVAEVAQRLDMPVPIVQARASGYRQQGARLKKFPRRNRRALDVDELNRFIEIVRQKQEAGTAQGKDVERLTQEVLDELERQGG